MATHAQTLEDLCGIRTSTNRTGLAKAVVLTVGCLTDTTKSMALHNTLETFTLGGSYYIDEVVFTEKFHSDSITEIMLFIINEFSQMTLGRNTCFLEVTQQRS